ncbi:hypothetical protein GINT2_001791 [Glugoides intestinalis]
MKSTEDEIRTLLDSESNPAPTLTDLERIAENVFSSGCTPSSKTKSFVSRLLPECYSTFTFNNLNIKNFHEETLLFIFYALPESVTQIKAYNELISKGYLFSKTLDTFVFFIEPRIADNKKKSIIVFSPFEWEKTHKEVLFDDKFIAGLEDTVPE